MKTGFEKVVDFNLNFGILESPNLVPKPDVFDKDPKLVDFCMRLIREEMNELEQAVKEKDFVETIDALADITYVVFGMAARLGLNMDTAFNLVHENNMSKLCKTEEEAKESVEYYIKHKDRLGYDSPNYRKAYDNLHWVVYNESTKKVLKSIKWQPVDLTSVCKP